MLFSIVQSVPIFSPCLDSESPSAIDHWFFNSRLKIGKFLVLYSRIPSSGCSLSSLKQCGLNTFNACQVARRLTIMRPRSWALGYHKELFFESDTQHRLYCRCVCSVLDANSNPLKPTGKYSSLLPQCVYVFSTTLTIFPPLSSINYWFSEKKRMLGSLRKERICVNNWYLSLRSNVHGLPSTVTLSDTLRREGLIPALPHFK